MKPRKCACPRCGFESKRDRWWDRHPFAAVLFALPAGYTLVGVILAYPWFFVPVLVVAAAWWVDRRQRRRAAVAARADWEHRELMRAAVFDGRRGHAKLGAAPPGPFAPALRAPRHVLTEWPTTPMLTRPIWRIR